ncbi:MAG: hypothetical protein GY950_07820, partial [bacterium]|nr:hypothetical protein [bacterium]
GLKLRALHVVNGLHVKATVSVPGETPVVVPASGRSAIRVTEGEIEVSVKVENGPTRTVKFTISDGWKNRILNRSIFILNVEGAAVIIREVAHYSEKPSPDDPYYYRFYVGEPLIKLDKVDYLFTELPKEIQLSSGTSSTKIRVGVVEGEAAKLVEVLHGGLVPPLKIFAFMETHLEILPDNELLLNAYLSLGAAYSIRERCIRFLEKELTRRPVLVNRHRAYQLAVIEEGNIQNLVARYDGFLEKEPADSALLYLRGQLENSVEGAFYYYDKAIAADPKNPFPYFAKSYHLACKGQFDVALKLCGQACALYPGVHSMKDRLDDLRLAVGEFDALEKKMTLQLDREPLQLDPLQKLLEILVTREDITGAKKALNRYSRKLKKQDPYNSAQQVAEGQFALDYLLKDFNAMQTHMAALGDHPNLSSYQRIIYLNRGDMGKLGPVPGKILSIEDIERELDGYTALLYWLGWLEKGNPQEALKWLKWAGKYFRESVHSAEKQVGQWLGKSNGLDIKQLDEVLILPEEKRILYTAFARLYPHQRKKLLARAQKMNYLRRFPYHFLSKTIGRMKRAN